MRCLVLTNFCFLSDLILECFSFVQWFPSQPLLSTPVHIIEREFWKKFRREMNEIWPEKCILCERFFRLWVFVLWWSWLPFACELFSCFFVSLSVYLLSHYCQRWSTTSNEKKWKKNYPIFEFGALVLNYKRLTITPYNLPWSKICLRCVKCLCWWAFVLCLSWLTFAG